MGTMKSVSSNGVSWPILTQLLIAILKPLLSLLTSFIHDWLDENLKILYQRAVDTPNPYDDQIVKFLCDILSIKVTEV